jgi:hypothetical protein
VTAVVIAFVIALVLRLRSCSLLTSVAALGFRVQGVGCRVCPL